MLSPDCVITCSFLETKNFFFTIQHDWKSCQVNEKSHSFVYFHPLSHSVCSFFSFSLRLNIFCFVLVRTFFLFSFLYFVASYFVMDAFIIIIKSNQSSFALRMWKKITWRQWKLQRALHFFHFVSPLSVFHLLSLNLSLSLCFCVYLKWSQLKPMTY